MTLAALRKDLKKLADSKKAKFLARFFKTGRGGYAESDRFLGLKVPQSRALAKQHRDLSWPEIKWLLYSELHEERLIALLILVLQFPKADDVARKKIVDFYLQHSKQVNNWDLVDLSADKILGSYLSDKPKSILYKLVRSNNLWQRRIAIVSTFHFIRQNRLNDTFKLAKTLLSDKHDLIHKATGWMLREAGKRDQQALLNFLNRNYRHMPRTMLRYSLEKLSPRQKAHYMRK